MTAIALVMAPDDVLAGLDLDTDDIVSGLRAMGVDVRLTRWREEDIPSDVIGAIVRAPWDYVDHHQEWLDWMARQSMPLHNPVPVVTWSLDKQYLLELEAHGVPIVPTWICASESELRDAIHQCDDPGVGDGLREVVVKPTISAGSQNTGRFAASNPDANALGQRILASGKRVVVQPTIGSVQELGEQAHIFFDGVWSHAVQKGPILKEEGMFSGIYREQLSVCEPTAPDLAVAKSAIAAAQSIHAEALAPWGGALLYGRIDVVLTKNGPAVLEAELFEPNLFLSKVDSALSRYLEAVSRRLVAP